jgi:hypothetical protein
VKRRLGACVRARSWKGNDLSGMCRPSGTHLICLSLPGTDVPGYRLFRPFGTALLRPVNNTAINGFSSFHAGSLSPEGIFYQQISEFRGLEKRTPTAKAGYGSVICGTAEALPFQDRALTRLLGRPGSLPSIGDAIQ